jgi:hypothetical protein
MVARVGVEPPTPAFSEAALWGEIGGSIHAAFELLPQQSNNLAGLQQDLSRVPAVPEHNVCLDCASKSDRQIWASNPATERRSMQNGSLIRAERQRGPAVWEFRWRELAGNGKRTHRRIVLGSVDRLVDEAAARQAVSARASHEVFRVISRHLGCGGWLKAKQLQALPARAVHLALKLGHVTRALANLFDRNASPRVDH